MSAEKIINLITIADLYTREEMFKMNKTESGKVSKPFVVPLNSSNDNDFEEHEEMVAKYHRE